MYKACMNIVIHAEACCSRETSLRSPDDGRSMAGEEKPQASQELSTLCCQYPFCKQDTCYSPCFCRKNTGCGHWDTAGLVEALNFCRLDTPIDHLCLCYEVELSLRPVSHQTPQDLCWRLLMESQTRQVGMMILPIYSLVTASFPV